MRNSRCQTGSDWQAGRCNLSICFDIVFQGETRWERSLPSTICLGRRLWTRMNQKNQPWHRKTCCTSSPGAPSLRCWGLRRRFRFHLRLCQAESTYRHVSWPHNFPSTKGTPKMSSSFGAQVLMPVRKHARLIPTGFSVALAMGLCESSCTHQWNHHISRIVLCDYCDQGPVSIRKTVFPSMVIPMLKIRRHTDRLIFNMGITIPGPLLPPADTGAKRHWHNLCAQCSRVSGEYCVQRSI